MKNKFIDHISFTKEYYKKYIVFLNGIGLKRSLSSFHLVDMYPSLKAMDRSFDIKKIYYLFDKEIPTNTIETASIYLHFPFCKNSCNYCHLYKENFDQLKRLDRRYIDSLKKEINMYTYLFNKKIKAKSIYFGGGTPSLLDNTLLSELLTFLKGKFIIDKDTFISFEIFPDSNFDKKELSEKLELLSDFGVKEIVLDLQSSNKKSLEDIGRGNSSPSSWKKIIKMVKKAGIARIKSAVILGLPFDTIETFKGTLSNIIKNKDITTVSLFLLEFRKGLGIYKDLLYKKSKFCDSGEKDRMQIMARKMLKDNGFFENPIHFFNRNKIRKKSEQKSALIGTSTNHLLGFGPSAYGHIVFKSVALKYINCFDTHEYMTKISREELPIDSGFELKSGNQGFSELINCISSDGVIDKKELLEKYNYDVEKKHKNVLSVFEKLKMMKVRGDKIIITEKGKLRAEEMLWYFYNENYKKLQRKKEFSKSTILHNYITVVSEKNEKLFDKFCLIVNKK